MMASGCGNNYETSRGHYERSTDRLGWESHVGIESIDRTYLNVCVPHVQTPARGMNGTGSPGMPARVGYSEFGGVARHGTRDVLRQSGVGRGDRMVVVAVGAMTALVNYGPEYGAVELRTVPVPAPG